MTVAPEGRRNLSAPGNGSDAVPPREKREPLTNHDDLGLCTEAQTLSRQMSFLLDVFAASQIIINVKPATAFPGFNSFAPEDAMVIFIFIALSNRARSSSKTGSE